MVKWVVNACNPAEEENVPFSREAGDQAPLNQKVSVAFHSPRIHSLLNVLVSLNVLFLTVLSLGNNRAFSKYYSASARGAWGQQST